MKILAIGCRVLLGLMFVVFGLNVFFQFIPQGGVVMPEPAIQLSTIMMTSGWMKSVGAFEVAGGILVLYGGTVPLGLTLLGPVLVNILLFHLSLTNGKMILPGFFASILEVVLVYIYRDNFRAIVTTRAVPTTK